MSYLQFLLFFLAPPILVLFAYYKKSDFGPKTPYVNAIALLCGLAFTYTTPWDNYLVATNVWGYGSSRVMGTIGYVPIEEYCFFFLQTVMSGLWCFFICSKNSFQNCKLGNSRLKATLSIFAILEGLSIAALFHTPTRYLGLILAWALPIIFLQLWFGLDAIKSNFKIFVLSVLPPTIYLWIADAFAIANGIWSISKEQTVGIEPFGLPIEEATFFLATNLMVGLGMILFVGARHEAAQILKRIFVQGRARKEKR